MLNQSCEQISGVGPAMTQKLRACGIHSIQDLLFHLPFRYQDRTRVTPIQDLRADDWCVITGNVCKIDVRKGRRMILECYIEDKTGVVKLRFFHFNKQQINSLTNAPQVRAFGQVRGTNQPYEMVHPEYKILTQESDFYVEETLTPIYPSTQGLTQNKIRQLIQYVLKHYRDPIQQLEWMDDAMLSTHALLPLAEALTLLHNPPPDTPTELFEQGNHPSLKRLVFDELLAGRISMQYAKLKRATWLAPSCPPNHQQVQRFLSHLPFTLTKAQQRVFEEIAQDLQHPKPMLRLVQGDVGSGKTVIAALAALQAIANGYQAALMAPTDILSEQHAETMIPWFEHLGIKIQRLTGKMKASERKEALNHIANHQCQFIVGTHALFQDAVTFSNLGLVIIDEQHRFGVEQRALFQEKGQRQSLAPHQLLMTATPIPRTLAMAQYAYLDLSSIDELPPDRTPVVTAVLKQDKRDPIIERVKAAISSGRQAYWVCTLIEESEKLQCIAATETLAELQAQLPSARVGLVHGKMKSPEKEATMTAFKNGDIDLLVATTVIEVGVNVPNASLMVIENAERLGLSQLHQLRGRIGRGSAESHCLLLYHPPLSHHGAERLRMMRATTDGFLIAEKDLELRGAGVVLGTQQTGYRQYKIANLSRDQPILPILQTIAQNILLNNPALAQIIVKRWLGDCEVFFKT